MATAEDTERTYKFVRQGSVVVVEGIRTDIPSIAKDLVDPKTELGKLAQSDVFMLKTRGFSLPQLRRELEAQNQSIDEHFPVQCRFDIDRKKYIVEHSDRQEFQKGQLI